MDRNKRLDGSKPQFKLYNQRQGTGNGKSNHLQHKQQTFKRNKINNLEGKNCKTNTNLERGKTEAKTTNPKSTNNKHKISNKARTNQTNEYGSKLKHKYIKQNGSPKYKTPIEK